MTGRARVNRVHQDLPAVEADLHRAMVTLKWTMYRSPEPSMLYDRLTDALGYVERAVEQVQKARKEAER